MNFELKAPYIFHISLELLLSQDLGSPACLFPEPKLLFLTG